MAMCSGRGQDAASRQAVRRIHSPSSHDEPALLGERNEGAGRDQPLARMVPAHQRLEAGDLAVDMRLRLVVQLELVARDGRAQILLQRALFAQLLVHRQFEEADRSARFRFGAEQRGIRIGDSVAASAPSCGKMATPTVSPTRSGCAVDVDIGIERRAQAFGQRLGGRRLRPGRRDDGEFVAAEAGEERALAGLLQPAAPLRATARRRPRGRTRR